MSDIDLSDQKKQGSVFIARAEKSDKDAIRQLASADHRESVFGDLPFSNHKFDDLFEKGLS